MKNINKLTLLVLVATLLLPMISAADYTFEYSKDAYFKLSCDTDGVPCSSLTTDCFITLRSPVNDYLLNNISMVIEASGDATFTIPANNLTEISPAYSGKVYCTNGVLSNTETFTLEVNGTGDDRGNGLFIILAICSLLVIGLAVIAENEYIGFMGGTLFIITGMYALIYGIGNVANMYTQAVAYVSIGLGFLFLIAAGYKAADGNVSFSSHETSEF